MRNILAYAEIDGIGQQYRASAADAIGKRR